MLGNQDAVATVAVKDLAAAKKFYEGMLGLKQIDAEGEEVVVYQTGTSRLNVSRRAAHRRLDLGDVDLPHLHHRLERALCDIAALGHRIGQDARGDLP